MRALRRRWAPRREAWERRTRAATPVCGKTGKAEGKEADEEEGEESGEEGEEGEAEGKEGGDGEEGARTATACYKSSLMFPAAFWRACLAPSSSLLYCTLRCAVDKVKGQGLWGS